MTKKDIRRKVGELVELRRQADELNKRVEDMENDFKACMERNGLQEVDAGEYRVRYVAVVNKRFDSKAFREAFPAMYSEYTKPTESRRFTVV